MNGEVKEQLVNNTHTPQKGNVDESIFESFDRAPSPNYQILP